MVPNNPIFVPSCPAFCGHSEDKRLSLLGGPYAQHAEKSNAGRLGQEFVQPVRQGLQMRLLETVFEEFSAHNVFVEYKDIGNRFGTVKTIDDAARLCLRVQLGRRRCAASKPMHVLMTPLIQSTIRPVASPTSTQVNYDKPAI